MLAKTILGADFTGLACYSIEKDKAEILGQNNCFGNDPKMLGKQYRAVWTARDTISKPVWHSILSFSKTDELSKKQMLHISERFLEKFGFTKETAQYTVVLHSDKDHLHTHIMANRIGTDGSVISDSWYKKLSTHFAKELEVVFNLEKVQDIAIAKRDGRKSMSISATSKSENSKRKVSPEYLAKREIKQIFEQLPNDQIKSFESLRMHLKEHGVTANYRRRSSDGQLQGVSFSYKGFKFKGSQLGKGHSALNLSRRFNITLAPPKSWRPPEKRINPFDKIPKAIQKPKSRRKIPATSKMIARPPVNIKKPKILSEEYDENEIRSKTNQSKNKNRSSGMNI